MTSVAWRSPGVWAVPAVGLLLLALLAVTGTNRAVFAAINGWSHLTGPGVWPFITVLGDTAVALTLFLPFALRRPDILWALAVSAVLATLFVHGFKPFFDEARPPAVLSAGEITIIGATYRAHSFPSGHTTTIFVAAALLFMALPALNLVNLSLSRILERASEIGVRKAFGASSVTLTGQFLIESIVLTMLGALIGLGLSAWGLRLLGSIDVVPYADLSLNLRAFLYGLVVALVFAVISGAYPAWKMSRLHPVEALHGRSA